MDQVRKCSTREGVCDAVKIGMGESYLAAFGVFLGGTPLQLGLLATVPPLAGSITQAVAVWILERLPFRKQLLINFIRLQSLIWLPILLIPLLVGTGWHAVAALVAMAVVYQITIGLIVPLWNSWLSELIPAESRGRFFGFRNRCMAMATFGGLLLAGEILHRTSRIVYGAAGFAVVFGFAGIARFLSSRQLGTLPDIPYRITEEEKFSFWQFLRRGKKSNFVKFVFFVSAMNFSAFISGPYFAPYMLRDMALSYQEYTILIAASAIAQFLVLSSWGSISDQFGNRTVLAVCGWQVAINPLLWLISSDFWYLIMVQVYSGFFWSGFNMAAANFVFDVATPAKRARCVAYFSIVNGVCVCLGSVLGGFLVTKLPHSLPLHEGLWTPTSPYLSLFLLSGICRILTVTFLLRRFKEVRSVAAINHRGVLKLVVRGWGGHRRLPAGK